MARKPQISPKDKALAELADAKETGKTDLSVTIVDDYDELLPMVFALTSLTDLTLNVGKLDRIPPGLGNLTQLESLRIEVEYNSRLETLPADIGKLTKLERLTCYSLKLTELPTELGNLVNLKKATLWSNELTTLPASFGRLEKLEELELQRNNIRKLPKELGGMKNLEELDLGNNELADLPVELAGMVKLRILNLEDNKLTSVPLAVCNMPSVQSANFEGNEIAKIPSEIRNAKSLQALMLQNNKLESLPDGLFDVPLVSLDLEGNQITKLPPGIARIKTLGELKLSGNPLEGIPEDIIEEGKEAIFDHLGLVKREVLTGDVPDDKTRAAIVKTYQERIDGFVRKSKSKSHNKKMLELIVNFITGKSGVVPAGRLDDHYSFDTIDNVFAPYPEWTFVDRRILRFITQGAWHFQMPGQTYKKGYAEDLLQWLEKQIAVETDETLFSRVVAEVVARGIDEDALFLLALYKHDDMYQRADGTPTSFGRYILDKVATKLDLIEGLAKRQDGVRDKLSGLLIRYDATAFEKLAATLLTIAPDKDGETHLPHGALEKVCAANPAKFEAILLDAIAKTDCLSCRAEGTKIMLDCYGAKHRAKALELTKATLKTISDNSNKEDRYHFSFAGEWSEGTELYIGWAIKSFGEDIRQAIFEFAENTKVFSLGVAEQMAKAFGQKAIDVLGEGLNMHIGDDDIASHFRRIFTLLAPLDYSKYHDKAWEIARSEFKQVRQTACMALGRLPADVVLPKAQELLASKKAHEREAGVLVLSQLDSKKAKTILEGLLETEKTDDARDIIVESFYGDDEKADREEIERRAASAKGRGKLDKPIAKWLDEKKLPALVWAGGKKPVSADVVRFLLQRQTRRKEIEADPEARAAYPLIDRKSSGAFAAKLLALVIKNGGVAAKNRFALALVGILGDDQVLEPLEELAVDSQNENAVRTIALVNTEPAARSLDRIAKVYRTKYPNMRQLAQEGFATIADGMGLTPFELADTMLPEFGFTGLTKPLVIAKTKLKATIGVDRKVALVDERGKVVKLPANASPKEREEAKALAHDVTDAAKQFKSSLEYYLIIQRQWRAADWKKFFLGHPLAFAFARSLIWGVCDGPKITTSFRVNADGALVDVGDKPVTLGKDALIALVHALDLAPGERTKWQAVLAREALEPPFLQIERPLFAVDDTDKHRTLVFSFEDKTVVAATFKSRAERLGWRRGSVIDSGEVSGYKKAYPRAQIEAFIRTANLSVQLDFDSEATLKDFFFVKSGSVVTGSYTYDEPNAADDPRLIKLSDVPPIIYSETISDLRNITRQKDAED